VLLPQDAYRKFKGPEGYATLDFVPSSVQEPRVEVTTMRMLDNSAAQLRWRLTGRLGMLPIDVAGAGAARSLQLLHCNQGQSLGGLPALLPSGGAAAPAPDADPQKLQLHRRPAQAALPFLLCTPSSPHRRSIAHPPAPDRNHRHHDEPADGAYRAAQRELGPVALFAARGCCLERGALAVGGQAGARCCWPAACHSLSPMLLFCFLQQACFSVHDAQPARIPPPRLRLLLCQAQASADASKAAGHALDSLTSMDDDEGFQQRNPADPSRFFQQNDTTKQDALLFVGVLLLFWALVQAWGDLFSGNSGLGGF
jgi:hypothetical protein